MAWHSGKPADSDFLSASVQHIRENFAELEPLQPHVAELVDLTALQPHVAALLSSRIVEMGTNSNGTYVRWENGLQICWHTFPEMSTPNAQGALYASTGSVLWTFPARFSVVPVTWGFTTRTSGSGTGVGFLAAFGGPSTTAVGNVNLVSTHNTFAGQPMMVAIGRWK